MHLAERVVALIKPKFYNRLAWAVVGVGLLLMSGPWWSDLVVSFAAQHLSITLLPNAPQQAWGLALVVLGLLYHIAAHYLSELIQSSRVAEVRSAQLEHDRRTFSEISLEMPESTLVEILGHLGFSHSIDLHRAQKLARIASRLQAPSSQFIDQNIQASALALGRSLNDLDDWFGQNFTRDDGPSGDEQFCLLPELRFCRYPGVHQEIYGIPPPPEQLRYYEQHTKQLYSKMDDIKRKYSAFRYSVKKALAV